MLCATHTSLHFFDLAKITVWIDLSVFIVDACIQGSYECIRPVVVQKSIECVYRGCTINML